MLGKRRPPPPPRALRRPKPLMDDAASIASVASSMISTRAILVNDNFPEPVPVEDRDRDDIISVTSTIANFKEDQEIDSDSDVTINGDIMNGTHSKDDIEAKIKEVDEMQKEVYKVGLEIGEKLRNVIIGTDQSTKIENENDGPPSPLSPDISRRIKTEVDQNLLEHFAPKVSNEIEKRVIAKIESKEITIHELDEKLPKFIKQGMEKPVPIIPDDPSKLQAFQPNVSESYKMNGHQQFDSQNIKDENDNSPNGDFDQLKKFWASKSAEKEKETFETTSAKVEDFIDIEKELEQRLEEIESSFHGSETDSLRNAQAVKIEPIEPITDNFDFAVKRKICNCNSRQYTIKKDDFEVFFKLRQLAKENNVLKSELSKYKEQCQKKECTQNEKDQNIDAKGGKLLYYAL